MCLQLTANDGQSFLDDIRQARISISFLNVEIDVWLGCEPCQGGALPWCKSHPATDRGDHGNVGIIRIPVCAIVLPDKSRQSTARCLTTLSVRRDWSFSYSTLVMSSRHFESCVFDNDSA